MQIEKKNKSVNGSMAIYAIGVAMMLLSQVVLTRLMGSNAYGIYYLGFTYIILASMISLAGSDQSMIKYLPIYIHNKDWGKSRGIISYFNQKAFLLSIIIMLITISLLLIFKSQIEQAKWDVFFLASLCVPIRSLIYIRQATLRSFSYIIRGMLPEAVISPGVIIMFGIFYLVSDKSASPKIAMAITLFAYLISLAVGALWQKKLLSKLLTKKSAFSDKNLWLKSAYQHFLINGSYLLINNIDIIILGYFNSPAEVGVYAIAVKVSSFIGFILLATYPALSPLITTMHAMSEKNALQSQIKSINKKILPIALIATALTIIFGKTLLVIFGSEFISGYPILCILALCQLFVVICGPNSVILTYTGHESIVIKTLATGALVSTALLFLLVPYYGLYAAAITTTFVTIGWNVVLLMNAKRFLNNL